MYNINLNYMHDIPSCENLKSIKELLLKYKYMYVCSQIHFELLFVELSFLFIYLFKDHCRIKNIFVREIEHTQKRQTR